MNGPRRMAVLIVLALAAWMAGCSSEVAMAAQHAHPQPKAR